MVANKKPRICLSIFWGAVLAFTVAINPAQAQQTFNVKSFGAVGNSTTNDTAAIQNAIAAANAHPGSTVLFPPGNYLYESELDPNSIKISGSHATLISANNAAQLVFSGSGCSLQNMAFSTHSNGTAVFFTNVSGFSAAGNSFGVGFGTDIVVRNSVNGGTDRSVFNMAPASTAVSILQSNTVAVDSNRLSGGQLAVGCSDSANITLSSNVIQNFLNGVTFTRVNTSNIAHNVVSTPGIDFALGICNNLTVSGNTITGSIGTTTAIFSNNDLNALFSRNNISGVASGIVMVTDVNDQALGNIIKNTGSGSGAIAALLTRSLLVSRNEITQCSAGGIFATADTDCSFTENSISESDTFGISDSGGSGTHTISKNALVSCGLLPSTSNTVIFEDSPSATSIPITGNSYAGNTRNLTFFIRCLQPSPPAQVSGNVTHTSLITVVGP